MRWLCLAQSGLSDGFLWSTGSGHASATVFDEANRCESQCRCRYRHRLRRYGSGRCLLLSVVTRFVERVPRGLSVSLEERAMLKWPKQCN